MRAVVRRTLTALVLAFGLALMHGGVGQAIACTEMSRMASQTMPTEAQLAHGHDARSAVDHAEHHQTANPPTSAHVSGTCVSTPVTCSGGDFKAGAAAPVASPLSFGGQPQHAVTISKATGRTPLPPDLVTDLCVIRR